ncbi:hypothetical protein C8Q73DRAFT_467351 [Cubamyces lactineus]|nr:hypothetical protein C8Q73DRAFT_467351 [Cubamyces lactineus]
MMKLRTNLRTNLYGFHMLALLHLAFAVAASPSTLQARQSDVCSGLACPANGEPCSAECLCIHPLPSSGSVCVPNSCVSAPCTTDADCCTTPLAFFCLKPANVTDGASVCSGPSGVIAALTLSSTRRSVHLRCHLLELVNLVGPSHCGTKAEISKHAGPGASTYLRDSCVSGPRVTGTLDTQRR